MKQIIYSAPGKVILSGEHAVVYGKPAFVTAIDMRLTVTVKASGALQTGKLGEIVKTVQAYMTKNHMHYADRPCALTVHSSIPVGRGLGSSAALSVASSAAILEFYTGNIPEKETVNNCAFLVEKMFHTNPSGVDTTASCFGGVIFFRREFDFLKTISKLHMKIPHAFASRLLLIDSGKPEETTAAMVEQVGKGYNRDAAHTDGVLNHIEKCTKRFVVACMAEDINLLKQSIMENQKDLNALGVVSPSTSTQLKKLETYGVGKITGAGGKKSGSGFLLFLADNIEKTGTFLQKNNISYLPFSPSLIGVQKEV